MIPTRAPRLCEHQIQPQTYPRVILDTHEPRAVRNEVSDSGNQSKRLDNRSLEWRQVNCSSAGRHDRGGRPCASGSRRAGAVSSRYQLLMRLLAAAPNPSSHTLRRESK